MKCPDHARDLKELRCPMCHAELMAASELETKVPGSTALLAPATGQVRLRERRCPQCEIAMAPLRIGKAEAFVERCPSCESYWVEKADLRTLEMLAKSAARQAAFNTLSDAEKKELAAGLAEATHVDTGPDVGVAGVALAAAGVPLVDKLAGDRTPFVTWLYAALLVIAHLTFGPRALAYVAGSSDLVQAFTSAFAHFGRGHLIGNLLFLVVFGAAAERKLPRWMLVTALATLGPLTALVQALDTADGTLIGGASGVIAGMLGMCLFLQPKARVTMMMAMPWRYSLGSRFQLVSLPLWLYGVGWALLQAAWWTIGVPGTGWLAHLSGFGAGLVLGFIRRPKS